MALSPEDVIKKSFSATHLRRGYDETQVDDFLDEVVVELRRLIAENDGLRTDLEDCRASRGMGGDETESYRPAAFADQGGRVGELEAELEELRAQVESERAAAATAAAAVGGGAVAAVPDADVEDLRRQLAECHEARAQAEERAQAAVRDRDQGSTDSDGQVEDLRAQVQAADGRVRELEAQLEDAEQRAEQAQLRAQEVEERASAAPAAALAATTVPGEDPTSIISLAQRLHDQHVSEGESTKSRLVGEAESYRDRVVADADAKSTELVQTGQETHDRLVHEGQTTHDELVQTGQETHDRLVGEGQAKHDELVQTGQQAHDDLVSEGQQERERLIGEGESTHETLVGEGQGTRDQLISEAENQRSTILTDLHQQQTSLSGRIGELQTQEIDLRDRLRAFLSDQLAKIDGEKS
ncbi:DivIVA domain-containing protein [Ornithinimicrobium sp. LYQ103]|uniref:DivIVA domain-containing protein n=1 Tax=Ornithinimicrobium sp. LYQ103 TaxID=3378796 RepID=UPI0038543587